MLVYQRVPKIERAPWFILVCWNMLVQMPGSKKHQLRSHQGMVGLSGSKKSWGESPAEMETIVEIHNTVEAQKF